MIYHDITMIHHDNILIEVIEVKFVICVDLQMFIAAGRFQGPIHQLVEFGMQIAMSCPIESTKTYTKHMFHRNGI